MPWPDSGRDTSRRVEVGPFNGVMKTGLSNTRMTSPFIAVKGSMSTAHRPFAVRASLDVEAQAKVRYSRSAGVTTAGFGMRPWAAMSRSHPTVTFQV